MSLSVNIRIKNLPQIRHAFGQAPRLMGEKFREALTKSAILVQSRSMIHTPVLTGRLRASHTFGVSGSGLGMKATVEPTANYAVFVHEGTKFMRGRPFLKQGADESVRDIDDFFTKAAQEALDKIGRMT